MALGSAVCLLVVGAIAGIIMVFERMRAPTTDALLVARAGLLLLMTQTFLGERVSSPRAFAVASVRGASQLIAAAILITAAVLGTHAAAMPIPGAARVGSVMAAAFVEEVVFRVQLPNRIERSLGKYLRPRLALTLAIAMSQGTFAVSHFVLAADVSGINPYEPLRLVAVGVVLFAVIRRVGLWLAVALHALVNLSLVLPPTDSAFLLGHATLAMWLIGAVCLTPLLLSVKGFDNSAEPPIGDR